MEWFDSCTNPLTITSRYKVVPALDPFPIYDCQLDPGLPSFSVIGYLPRLPDHPALPEGQIPDRAELYLSFMDLQDLALSGIPDTQGGKLQINKISDSVTEFSYESTQFRFTGVCDRAVMAPVRVLPKFDPSRTKPRGPKLVGHANVWNTCLLLLREWGYSLRVSGHWTHREYPAVLLWHAWMSDGTDLTGHSPIELLGLAALHRHHSPNVDEPYWWRIDGPSVFTELTDEWQRQLKFADFEEGGPK